MDFSITHYLELGPRTMVLLTGFQEKLMGKLSDAIAEAKAAQADETASLDAAIARVQGDVSGFKSSIDALNAKIVDLQATVDAGGASEQDIADLAALKQQAVDNKAKADALDPATAATLPTAS